MLNYLKNSFENSSLKVKIELYLLPLLLIFLLYLLFFEEQNLNFKENSYKNELLALQSKKFDEPILELLKTTENLAKSHNIFIQKIESVKEQIFLKAKSKQSDLLHFLQELENLNNFTKITTLNLSSVTSEDLSFDLKLDVSNYYIKNGEKIIKNRVLESPKKIEVETTPNKMQKLIDFKISAVVGEYAFINNIWIKKGEFIDDFEVINVDKNYVLLKNSDEIIKLEVNSVKAFENIN